MQKQRKGRGDHKGKAFRASSKHMLEEGNFRGWTLIHHEAKLQY